MAQTRWQWKETSLTKEQFKAQLLDVDIWEVCDGGVADALEDGKAFLDLAERSCPEVVILQEGYRKLQSAALNRQLPPELRSTNLLGWKGLPPPAPLYWLPSANMLHPLQLLSRELTGSTAASAARCPLPSPSSHLQPVPFGVVERCKLLDVQYVLKELQLPRQQPAMPQPQDMQHAMGWEQHSQQVAEQQTPAAQQSQPPPPQLQQQQAAASQQDNPFREYPLPYEQQSVQRVCRRVSVRVVLQRLPAAPPPDEEQRFQQGAGSEAAGAAGSGWQQRGLLGAGEPWQQAYTCTLEYPAFTLKSSDYLVAADVFDSGLASWQALRKGDTFWMPWDGTPYRGSVLGYRKRTGEEEAFLRSPWWSIAVQWEEQSTDRSKDPEDWCYGNPWEMTREQGSGPPSLPDTRALAAARRTGQAVLAAPWTNAWAAATSARTAAKRKRTGHHHRQYDDDFVYEDQDHEEDTGTGAAEDAWDPTEFYYDDDPEDFELHTQQRRKSARQQHRGSSRRSEPRNRRSNSPTDAGCSWAAERGAQRAAADGPAHEHGREVLVRTDVCLVCGSSGGTLVSGHVGQTGRTCSRQYHAGCLLLLNAVGIRSVTLAKSGQGKQRQQQRRQPQLSRSSGGGGSPPGADGSAQAAALSDGLLGVLWQEALQPGNQLSLSVLAAISAAQEAALRVASGELALCCPSHSCHGCQLNGKQEVMVWCCCCWVRVYHHTQCVPYGAEWVKVDGKDFVRCPHCRAAGVHIPGTAAAPAAHQPMPADGATLGGGAPAPAAADVARGAAGDAQPPAAVLQLETAPAAAPSLDLEPAGASALGPVAAVADTAAAAPADCATSEAALATAIPSLSLSGEDAAADSSSSDTPAGTALSGAMDAAGPAESAQGEQQEQQEHLVLPHRKLQAHSLQQQRQQPPMSITLLGLQQEGALPVAAAAAAAAPQPEVVELLESSDPAEPDTDGDVIVIDSSDECHADQEQQGKTEQHWQQQQQQQRGAMPQQQQVDGMPVAPSGEMADEDLENVAQALLMSYPDLPQQLLQLQSQPQQQSDVPDSSGSLQPTTATAPHDSNEANMDDVLAEFASLEAQVTSLQQQQQQLLQQQEHPVGVDDRPPQVVMQQRANAAGAGQLELQQPALPQAAAVGAQQQQAADVTRAASGAAAGSSVQHPRIPGWLQLSLEDTERFMSSYWLVPAPGGSRSSSPRDADDAGGAADALTAAAAAAWTLPPAAGVPLAAAGLAVDDAAAAQGPRLDGAAAVQGSGLPEAAVVPVGLQLSSPHSHWLIGCLSKAETTFRPGGVWGCAMIGVPNCPDDSVYGLAVVVDFLPTLEQLQQRISQRGVGQAAGAAAAAAEATGGEGAVVRGKVGPAVYLRCNRVVARDGKRQPAMQMYNAGEKQQRGSWQVLVNGQVYRAGQGTKGLLLREGDVVTVQGMSFRLQSRH